MSVQRAPLVPKVDNFDYPISIGNNEVKNGWAAHISGSTGTPTIQSVTEDGGAIELALTADNEAQVANLFHEDYLMLDVRKIHNISWIVKVTSLGAGGVVVCGLGSARNDTEDDVATNAWFKLDGAVSTSNLVGETDDGTNDNNDVALNATLDNTKYKKLELDFTRGLDDVRFYVDGRKIETTTKFDMSKLAAGANVQPYVQLRKASGTDATKVTIAQFCCTYEYAYGAP